MTQNTLITFLLDRSGSIESVRDDTIGAFNAYLDDLKAEVGVDLIFNLVQFNGQGLEKVCVRRPVSEVHRLDRNSYVPRGWLR